MNALAAEILWALVRTTLVLAIATLLAAGILRYARANWPTGHRLVWLLVLAMGWTFMRVPVAIPWYEPIAGHDVSRAGDTPVLTEPVDLAAIEPNTVDPSWRAVSVDDTLQSENPLSTVMSEESLPAAASASSVEIRPAWTHHWPLAILALWVAGVVALPLAWGLGYVRFVHQLPPGIAPEEIWQSEWNQILHASGSDRRIPLRVTAELGPVICRLPRGYEIIVPHKLWSELDSGQRRAILRHELAHLARGDMWKSLAVRVLALPHWFNPASWLAVRHFDEAAEWACDRAATVELPETSYAKVLLQLGSISGGSRVYMSAARGRTLAVRIRRLVSDGPREDSKVKKLMLVTGGLLLAAVPLVRLELVALAVEPPAPPATAPPESESSSAVAAQTPAATPAPQAEGTAATEPVTKAIQFLGQNANGKSAVAAASPKMIDEARQAFEGTLAEYKADQASRESVYLWSVRWMRAAENAAAPAARVAAVRDHIQRMRDLQAGIKALYDLGARGGEVSAMAAANFYVAEAEFWLAQAEQKSLSYSTTPRAQPTPAASNTRLTTVTSPPVSAATILDTEIQIVELEGKLQQANLELQAAEATLSQKSSLDKSVVPLQVVRDLKVEVAKRTAQRDSLQTTLRLYQKKLELSRGAGPAYTSEAAPRAYQSARPGQKGANPYAGPPAVADAIPDPKKPGQPGIRYNGRDYDEWVDELRGDLSPERRKDAFNALGTLGALRSKEDGARAAELILHTMRDYSVWAIDGTPLGQMKEAALEAFKKLPPDVARPAAEQALRSDSANERLFAVMVLPWLYAPAFRDAAPELVRMLADPSPEVRNSAIGDLLRLDPTAPALVEALHKALSTDNGQLLEMLRTLREASKNSEAANTLAGVIPDLLRLLDRGGFIEGDARSTLYQMGPAALEGLESFINAEGGKGTAAGKARKIYDEIRARPAVPPGGPR